MTLTGPARRLSWILLLALLVRVAFVVACPQAPVVHDAAGYDADALRLAAGETAAMTKGPIYPMFLAVIYGLFGHAQTVARIVQTLISTLSVWLIYLLADRVFHRQAAEVAAMIAAVYPAFISYAGWLLTETLSVFLLVAFTFLLVRAMGRPGVWAWAAAGFVGGITALHREELLVIVVLSGLTAWWWRSGARRIGVFAFALGLTIFPWTVRNYVAYHDLVLVSPGAGQQAWISTVQVDGARWDAGAPHMDEYRALADGVSPVEADRRLRRAALQRVMREPLSYLALCAKRIPAFWIGGHSNTFTNLAGSLASYVRQRDYPRVCLKLLLLAFNLGVIVLGWVGIYLVWRVGVVETRYLIVLALPVVVKALTHVFLLATLRYQVPIMPFLIIFAACAIEHARRVILEALPAHA